MIKVNKLDFFFVSRYNARDSSSHGISRSPKFIHGTFLNTHYSVLPQEKQASEGTETETETSLAFCLFLGVRLFVIQD